MATPRTSGRSADLSGNDEIIKKARSFIELLGKPTLSATAKADLIVLLEEVIESRQQRITTTSNRPETAVEVGQTNVSAERFDAIEQKLEELKTIAATNTAKVDELKTIITTTSERTYAQIAASGTTATTTKAKPTIGPEKVRQREQAKREREQYEVTLTAYSASKETKVSIDEKHAKELKIQFQKAVDAVALPDKPKVVSVNKIERFGIRLLFRTPEQVEQVRKAPVDWDIAYEGVKANKPIYGIVVHGVRTDAINLDTDHSNTIKEWEEENSDRGITITKVMTLRRTAKHRPTTHCSLKIYTEDKDAANKCIQRGFIIDSLKHKVERYAPQWYLNQCYKCHGFGHRATFCKRKEKCGNCSEENHVTANCTASKHQCVNCKGDHQAWYAKCPARVEESKRLATIRSDPSTTYFP